MKWLGYMIMILNLHRQGLMVSVIARQVRIDRKTVRKYIERGVEVPTYGPRQPRDRSASIAASTIKVDELIMKSLSELRKTLANLRVFRKLNR